MFVCWIWNQIGLAPRLFLYIADVYSSGMFSCGGILSQVWLARQAPHSLDHNKKYYSKVTAFGRQYVDHRQVCMCVGR